ncbi:protein kinase domain-containing protein [Alterinioella nitratireducens]|uniref:protein kinase domain-containing protein n=1 Tax=Alterinioella nitratireducens TaxID=2735915 RepID=UPI0040582FC0
MSYDSNQPNIQKLKKEYSERTRRTVFFVGAGASAEVGMPLWAQLKENLFTEIDKHTVVLNEGDPTTRSFRKLEALRNSNESYWDFFETAELGWPTVYEDFMEREFDEKISRVSVPTIYERIWGMRHVRQVLTLNVDMLLTAAFNSVVGKSGERLLEYDGFSLADSFPYFSRDNYVVANLHGTYSEKSRWIMSERQRKNLYDGALGDRYKRFIERVFSEYNVVFVGLNTSDIAISPFLETVANLGLLAKHFWIVPSPNPNTLRWAEQKGLRVVSYNPLKDANGQRTDSIDICSILEEIDTHESKDSAVQLPSTVEEVEIESLQTPELMIESVADNRLLSARKLSGAMTRINNSYGPMSNQARQFLERYRLAIQSLAMMDSKMPGYDTVHDYRTINRIASKGSSSVWLCEQSGSTEQDNYFALKIMSTSGIDDPIERESFRRGIESLFLLKKDGIDVGPDYITHYEIPLLLVMEIINGSSAKVFRENVDALEVRDVLTLFLNLCRSVLRCHRSDGAVLHRDLKPSNIILENWYPGYDVDDAITSPVRLINFDLSWHRFTTGNTKAISAEDIGFYAPEQKPKANGSLPRTALTDVYMLGMMFYYLLAGESPPDGGGRLGNWGDIVKSGVRSATQDLVLRNRLMRLVLSMSESSPDDRPDLDSVTASLEGMRYWLDYDVKAINPDYLVEYLSLTTGRGVSWNEDNLSASIEANQTTVFELRYSQRGSRVEIRFIRRRSDSDNRANFGKRMNEKLASSANLLREIGWEVDKNSNLGITGSCRTNVIAENLTQHATTFRRIADSLLGPIE